MQGCQCRPISFAESGFLQGGLMAVGRSARTHGPGQAASNNSWLCSVSLIGLPYGLSSVQCYRWQITMCPLQLNHLGLPCLGRKGILEKEEIPVFPLAGYLAKGSNTEER